MENLNDYFLYNYDGNGLSGLFDAISDKMKEIHEGNRYVANLSSLSIMYDGSNFSFGGIEPSYNQQYDKRRNIVGLAKLMLGSYLSVANGFKDFSEVDDNWFIQNIDDICSNISDDDFEPDYFYAVFTEGSNEYYSDFLDRLRQNASIGGKANTNVYAKVLSNGAGRLYSGEDEEKEVETTVEKKTAHVMPIFYPLLIGLSLTAVMAMYLIFKYL